MFPPLRCPTILFAAALIGHVAQAQDLDSAQVEFFEKRIRPVLVEHCYECHSAGAKKLQGALLLDSRDGARMGGDSGPAVVPKNVGESLLISALKYDEFEMPPKGKLPKNVIGDFVKWIEMGALDPRNESTVAQARTIDIEKGREHWAYQTLREPKLPDVENEAWPNNVIDRFVLARLEANGMLPSVDADAEVLVRRVYYDLIGLPPTPEEIDDYLQSVFHNPDSAFESLVDRLLASPRFGERWGRHWLDVVRFGESNTLRGTVFTNAWRYRDYVIDSFNDDLPFNQFVVEQIAGDLLPSQSWQDGRRRLIATGMLSLGNSNFENQDKGLLRMDVVDEQLEVIGRAFMGQTIACARCHDHKFDPIPTRDYYALAGILRNTKTLEHSNVSRWLDVPLPADPATEAERREHAIATKELQQKIAAVKKTLGVTDSKVAGGAKVVAIESLPGVVVDDTTAILQGAWTKSTSNPRFVGSNYIHDAGEDKGKKSVTFETKLAAGQYEVRVAYANGTNRSPNTPVTVWHADGETTRQIDQRKKAPIDGVFVSLGKFTFAADEPARVVVSNRGTSAVVIADAVQFLDQKNLAQQNLAATAKKPAPKTSSEDKAKQAEVAAAKNDLKMLEAELKKLQSAAPAGEMTMSVVEEKEIGDTQIHVRGNVHNLGAKVPRGFLQVVSYGPAATFSEKESGRRQLGEWLASNDNPLTARVTVNRLWHWMFGAGLVRTTDNFGTVGELPSHPELLDHLALHFQREGWSVKSVLRQMVLSRTYRMSSYATEPKRSRDGSDSAEVGDDVENRLLWRMNRRRLEAECIRDSILAVADQLQLDMHGPTFPASQKADYDFKYKGSRRSLYAPVFRNSMLDVFGVFDFADPSIVVGRRSVSTVAPQALFMMNNPMVIEQSRRAAQRLFEKSSEAGDRERIEIAYRLALARRPTSTELQLATQFLEAADESSRVELWAEFYQALFATLDFRYVD